MGAGRNFLVATILSLLALSGGTARDCSADSTVSVAFDPTTTFQTMNGWEATAYAGQASPQYAQFKDEVLRQAVEDVGIDRVRVEVRSGAENSEDYWQQYQDGTITDAQWRSLRYSTVNDNADPDSIDPNGFHFSELDADIVDRVLPLKARLEARGETLHVNLCYVAFTYQNDPALAYDHADPAEYSEFVLAAFRHLSDTYGLVPDSLELLLEPDQVPQWNGHLLGQALVAAQSRLAAAGFHPGFVGPSTTAMSNAVTYFDEMAQVEGAVQHLTQISYHRYGGVSTTALQAIADRAVAYGIETAQLEHIGAHYEELHEDLSLGRNSSWSQFALASDRDDGGAYSWVDESGAAPVVRMGFRTRYLRLYFLWVRRGAVRVGATSSDPVLAPLAFVNADQRPTVVVRAEQATDFVVTGLPAGTYGIRYATPTEESVDLADVHIDTGGQVAANIPHWGVASVYAKSLDPPPPPDPPDIVSSSPTGTSLSLVAGTSQTFSVTAQDPHGRPLTFAWDVDGTAAGSNSASFSFAAASVGAHVVTATVLNGVAQAQRSWNVQVTPVSPDVVITGPSASPAYLTTASAVDLTGTASSDDGVTGVTWSNDRGGSGTASGTTSWSVSGVSLAAGANVLTVTVTDGAAKTAQEQLNVFRDTQDPAITISAPSTTGAVYLTTSPTLNVSGTASDDHGIVAVTWSSDRGGSGTASGTASWTAASVVLSPGRNQITVRAHDALGREGTATLAVDYDASAPAISVTSPTSVGSVVTSAATIDVAGTAADDLGVTSVSWTNSLGGTGTASGTTSWSAGSIALSQGQNVIRFTATDLAGRTSNAIVLAVRDDAGPVVAITSPSSDFATTSPAISLAGYASDESGVSFVAWSNDRGGSGDASGTTRWSAGAVPLGLPPGSAAGAATAAILDLVPGSGFTSATGQPAAIGSGPGSDAKAIARWDVVPYQTFTGRLPVGVVAFHMSGIDRVEFSVEGGPWTAVRSMTKNPVTGVWEYNAYVDAATLADGRAEVRAIVYPTVGIPRVLAGPHDENDRSMSSGEYSLVLSADAAGTLPSPVRWVSASGDDAAGDGTPAMPFATIARAAADIRTSYGTADGATIHLTAGDHAYPDVSTGLATTNRWLTLAAAPGLTRDEVRITSSAGGRGLNAQLVHLKGLTVSGTSITGGTPSSYCRIWTDDCVLEGTGATDNRRLFWADEWSGGIFATGCVARRVEYPCLGFMLARDLLISDCAGDGVRDPAGLVVNCEVRDIVSTATSHNDVVQLFDPWPRTKFENVVVYGLRAVRNCEGQGLFVSIDGPVVLENFAFVNCILRSIGIAQWQTPARHLLIWNCGFLNTPAALASLPGGIAFVDAGQRPTVVHDLSIRNSVIQRFLIDITGTEPVLSDTSWADGNHFVDATSHGAAVPGTHATTGGTYASLFKDAANEDYTPAVGPVALAPGRNRITVLARDALGHDGTSVVDVYYDLAAPTVAVTSPTVAASFATGASTLVVAGTTADDGQIASVTWTNDRGGSGTATGTTSWTTSAISLSPGANVLSFTATDTVGRTSVATLSVFHDAQIPVVTVASPTTGTQFLTGSSSVTLSGTATDDGGIAAVTWTNDRGGSGSATGTGDWSTGPVALLPGSNRITISATDAYGRTGTAEIAVYHDATAPAIALTSPAGTASIDTLAATQIVSGTASDDATVASVTWTNDRGGSGTATGTTTWTASAIPLFPGANVLTFTATDAVGRTAATVLTVNQDVAPPTISVSAPSSTGSFDSLAASQVVSGTASDDVTVASVTWTNDRGGSGTATGTTSWTTAAIPLFPGANVLTFTATDTVGRTAATVLTVKQDIAPPTIAVTSPTSTGSFDTLAASQAVSGTASDDVTVASVTWTNDRGGSGTATGTTSWTTAAIALFPGTNVLTVTATDTVGRTTTALLTVNQDVAPPTIAVTAPTATGSFDTLATSQVISGTASDDVTVASVTWTNDRGGSGTATGTASWTTSAIPLFPGANLLTFTATDTVGRTTTTVLTVNQDVAPPTIAITAPTSTGSFDTLVATQVVSGTASDDVTVASVTWTNDRGGSGTATGTTSWTTSAIPLFPGANVLTLTATDTVGRTTTAALTVVQDALPPVVAVNAPTSAGSFDTLATSQVVSGTASDDVTVASVTWANDRGGSGTATGTTSWTTAAIPLFPGANVLTFTATDTVGRTSTALLTVMQDAAEPTVAILAPTSAPDFTTTSASLPVSGFASDDVSVALVTWTNDRGGGGTAAGTVSWSAGTVGLLPGPNLITIVARDTVGRQRSVALTIWRDVAVPVISVTSPTAAGSTSTASPTVTVAGSASDDLSVASVAWTSNRGGSGTATGTASWSAGPIALASGDNVLTFTATDTAGRTGTTVLTVTSDYIVPGVTIATPTLAPTFVTARPALLVGGTATDDQGLASIAWSNDRGGAGSAAGLADWTATVPLASGANVVSVTATDLLGNTATSTVTIDFRPASIGLAPGYNLISLPCVPDAPFNASTLLTRVNSAGGRAMAILDLSPGDPSLLLAMGAGRDFPVVPGRSYFVLSESSSATGLDGDALSVAPVGVTLRRGLNYVALPVTSAAPRTASDVAADVAADGGDVLAISRWRNGRAEPYVPGLGLTDFDLSPGEGFIVLCGRDSVWQVAP